jgi:hypothetical protein
VASVARADGKDPDLPVSDADRDAVARELADRADPGVPDLAVRREAAAAALSGVARERGAGGPPSRQLLALRGNTFGVLAMLIVQFAIGVVVNLYATIPATDTGSGIFGGIGRALTNGPASLAVHAGLGLFIVLAAIALVVRSIIARHTVSTVLSVIGLAAIAAAALNGARFVADGGAASASLAMALSTAVAMLCYATSLLLLGFSRPSAD